MSAYATTFICEKNHKTFMDSKVTLMRRCNQDRQGNFSAAGAESLKEQSWQTDLILLARNSQKCSPRQLKYQRSGNKAIEQGVKDRKKVISCRQALII